MGLANLEYNPNWHKNIRREDKGAKDYYWVLHDTETGNLHYTRSDFLCSLFMEPPAENHEVRIISWED